MRRHVQWLQAARIRKSDRYETRQSLRSDAPCFQRIDAMAEPYRAIQRTSVARIGDYVVPEDRLTLNESRTVLAEALTCRPQQGRE
jgi:hypothetical protein